MLRFLLEKCKLVQAVLWEVDMRVLACGGRLGAGAKLFQRYSVLLLFLALVVFGGMRSALAGDFS